MGCAKGHNSQTGLEKLRHMLLFLLLQAPTVLVRLVLLVLVLEPQLVVAMMTR